MERDLECQTEGSARREREIFLRIGNESGKNHGQDSMLRVHVHVYACVFRILTLP